MPYLYKQAIETSQTGVPTMRSMVLEFTEDKTCHYVDRQYMLGENLLVAPIFNEEGIADYYLPKGTWTNYFTSEKVIGEKWIKEKHGYLSMPLMVKENSIIAVGNTNTKPDYDYAEDVELRVYELQQDTQQSTVVYGMDGEKKLEVTIGKWGNEIKIQLRATKPCVIRLVNQVIDSATGAGFQIEGNDTLLLPELGKVEVLAQIN